MKYRIWYLVALSIFATACTAPPAQATFCDFGCVTYTPRYGIWSASPAAVEWRTDEQLYELTIHEGWNLISLPNEPIDTAITSITADSRIVTVLTYRTEDKQWESALLDEGTWRGTLDTMHSGLGYWVFADAEHTLEIRLSTANEPQEQPYLGGWNLVGLWDPRLRPHGALVNAGDVAMRDPDSDVSRHWRDWKVAYSYDPVENLWSKVLPGDSPPSYFRVGYGTWIYITMGPCAC